MSITERVLLREERASLGRDGDVAVGLADRERAGVVGPRAFAITAQRRRLAKGEQVERDLARRAELAVDRERLLEVLPGACSASWA